MQHPGEVAALLTACFWTVTALSFEAASKRIGSMSVNLLRLIAGFLYLSFFTWIYRGHFFPVDATPGAWFYLVLSGLVGFVFGDLCLFQAFVVIGARVSMLLMALAPPITALIGWIILGEKLTAMNWLGMAITIAGIALVVLRRDEKTENSNSRRKVRFSFPLWGVLLGLGGAVGQGAGLVLSKYGMQDYDPFAASQIRVLTGIVGFSILFTILGRWRNAIQALSLRKPMIQLSVGAFFGPFLGVSFSLLSIQLTSTGIAATIMAIVPVLIIAPAVIINKEKVTVREIAGAVIAVGGVALFFI